jgi:hypothetical protein
LLELRRGYDLAGVGEQKTKRRQFPGREVNDGVSAEKGAIGFQAETGEEDCRFSAPAACAREAWRVC